ncbi:hypothetical protein Tco_0956231 [Tanacetum coccineum]|uniref:Uncharacterized protein n=1 Tax=Tanacetum coccineum TaxID=301880 RepID=A0ABQ5E9I1_9ASTR
MGIQLLKLELCTNLQQRVLDLEKTKTNTIEEIARVESSGDEQSLGEDTSKQGRINVINTDDDITLVSVHDMNVSVGEVEVAEVINTAKLIIDVAQFSVASDKVSTARACNNKKDQLKLDEEIALKLQAEIDKEERIARSEDEKIDEANIAWDDIQAKVNADYQLVKRLQAEEQEQFIIEEKATLFKELLEQRRKHFTAKRAEEKRNKLPTKTQQKKIMITYLKNMEAGSTKT